MTLSLTPQESIEYFHKLGKRVLAHRYRYYVLDDSVIPDWEYDLLERLYEALASELNLPSVIADMVGYDLNDPLALEVKGLVDAELDDYSLWANDMQKIYAVLGLPKRLKQELQREPE